MPTEIKCNSCGNVVTGYEHRIRFVLVDGERIKNGDYAVLNCGCEILDYEMEVRTDISDHPVRMIDSLRRTTVMEFSDNGPINKAWDEYDCC